MRTDGRRPDELRPLSIEPGAVKYAEGSALIRMGDTHVLCAASVEESVPPHRKGSGKGWITAEYSLLPRSTHTRTSREIKRGRPDGRIQEIQRLIGRSLRACADFSALGERSIIVDCDVLRADGGTRTAAVTGGWVALALACARLAQEGKTTQPVLSEGIAAISAGIVKGEAVLDLPYAEDSTAEVDLNVVMTASGNLVEIQGTAEHAPFGEASLQRLLALARSGIASLIAAQQSALSVSR